MSQELKLFVRLVWFVGTMSHQRTKGMVFFFFLGFFFQFHSISIEGLQSAQSGWVVCLSQNHREVSTVAACVVLKAVSLCRQ